MKRTGLRPEPRIRPCLKAHRRPLGYFLFGISPDEPVLAFTPEKDGTLCEGGGLSCFVYRGGM